jgi:RNA polymerase sigma-70 factor (ECF subfamily)
MAAQHALRFALPAFLKYHPLQPLRHQRKNLVEMRRPRVDLGVGDHPLTTTGLPDTEHLLARAEQGDPSAAGQLLERHRARLKRMVAVRLDRRLAARVDPSDVVQESLAEAARRLPEYLRDRPLPFYPWLRRLTADRLAVLYRRHVRAANRAVGREEPPLPDQSAVKLADRLFARHSAPSARLRRQERRDRVRVALAALAERDREVLVLRYLEELSVGEIAAVLDLTEMAVYARHLRALKRLKDLLGPDFHEDA